MATEICDGIDNDCDGAIDGEGVVGSTTWYTDSDGDGFGDPDAASDSCDGSSGLVADDSDCDDDDADVHPDATEVCDEIDNNCNGWTDDEDPGLSDGSTFYLDYDSDGYGSADYTTTACDVPDDYTTDATDCDDLDATTHPGADEVCDEVDNDCDGLVDADDTDLSDAGTLYADSDGDGYGDPASSTASCEGLSGYVDDATDCDDGDADISPEGSEICDEIDNDCDGLIDDDDEYLNDGDN